MNTLSSHRIRSSVTTPFKDVSQAESSMISNLRHVISDRAPGSRDRPSMLSDSPTSNERTNASNGCANVQNDRSYLPSSRSSLVGGNIKKSPDRRNISNDQPIFQYELRHAPNDRSYIPIERPNISSPEHSVDMPPNRVSNGRATVSIASPDISNVQSSVTNNLSKISPTSKSSQDYYESSSNHSHVSLQLSDHSLKHSVSGSKTSIFKGEIFRSPETPHLSEHLSSWKYNERFQTRHGPHPATTICFNDDARGKHFFDNRLYLPSSQPVLPLKVSGISESQKICNTSITATDSVQPVMTAAMAIDENLEQYHSNADSKVHSYRLGRADQHVYGVVKRSNFDIKGAIDNGPSHTQNSGDDISEHEHILVPKSDAPSSYLHPVSENSIKRSKSISLVMSTNYPSDKSLSPNGQRAAPMSPSIIKTQFSASDNISNLQEKPQVSPRVSTFSVTTSLSSNNLSSRSSLISYHPVHPCEEVKSHNEIDLSGNRVSDKYGTLHDKSKQLALSEGTNSLETSYFLSTNILSSSGDCFQSSSSSTVGLSINSSTVPERQPLSSEALSTSPMQDPLPSSLTLTHGKPSILPVTSYVNPSSPRYDPQDASDITLGNSYKSANGIAFHSDFTCSKSEENSGQSVLTNSEKSFADERLPHSADRLSKSYRSAHLTYTSTVTSRDQSYATICKSISSSPTPTFSPQGSKNGNETNHVPPKSASLPAVISSKESASFDIPFKLEKDERSEQEYSRSDSDNSTANCDSPTSMHDRSLLLPDRPSMLSECPSMLSSVPSRPSMVRNDVSGEECISDQSLSHKSNVVRRGKRKKYQKYTPADRIAIGKFCFEHGPAAARKAFQTRYPEMSESVTRGFRDKYKQMIGESAVYEFEQKRRREMNVRTEALPRGRPRKYKPVETNDIPVTSVSIAGSETILRTKTLESTSEETVSNVNFKCTSPGSPVETVGIKREKYNDIKSLLENCGNRQGDIVLGVRKGTTIGGEEICTSEKKMIIGWFCAKHGKEVALEVFLKEHPTLTAEMVDTFHKHYLESEGRISENRKRNVYVVDEESSTTSSVSTSTVATSSQITDIQESLHNHSSLETESVIARQDKASDFSKPHEEVAKYSESFSPVISVSHPVVTIPISPHSITPIIHYPKLSSDVGVRRHHQNDQRDARRDYSSMMESNGEHHVGYPYDRPAYYYSDEAILNGSGASLPRTKRFKYQKYSPEDRYNIGKLCNDIGLGATVKVYREQFPRLNESVVRTFRNKYRELLQKGNGIPITESIQRKPSRRSITTLIESEVVSQLRQFKESSIELTEKLVMAVAENVIASKDQNDIGAVKNTVSKEWASSLLWKHKLIERRVSNPNGVCCDRCKTQLICPKC